jgi:hypothetical protein
MVHSQARIYHSEVLHTICVPAGRRPGGEPRRGDWERLTFLLLEIGGSWATCTKTSKE